MCMYETRNKQQATVHMEEGIRLMAHLLYVPIFHLIGIMYVYFVAGEF